jgi:hypothetical protein
MIAYGLVRLKKAESRRQKAVGRRQEAAGQGGRDSWNPQQSTKHQAQSTFLSYLPILIDTPRSPVVASDTRHMQTSNIHAHSLYPFKPALYLQGDSISN